MTLFNPSAVVEKQQVKHMFDFYQQIVLPLFFKLEPEVAHRVAMRGVQLAARLPLGQRAMSGVFGYEDPRLAVDLFGLRFRNPVGLAAGYDKDAEAVRELATLGFGHLEVGTVTPKPQGGNAGPRIFRLPQDRSVINRMGFPNQGAEVLSDRLRRARNRRRPLATQIGVNIGKWRHTPLDEATGDYVDLMRRFHPFADFIAINVSSPNTPDLRKLQSKEALEALLGELAKVRNEVCPTTPWLLKIAPDLSFAEIDEVLDVMMAKGVSGIIATNTTVSRNGLSAHPPAAGEVGGLSGDPLRQRSTEIIRHIYRRTQGKLPIIGVGGVGSVAGALEKIRAGASMVQVYTGLIYQGPGLVRAINRGLAAEMDALGVQRIQDLVGTAQ